jgi:hypothetical protein
MAFHPFTWFRKHQKVIFAILTIVCMFVFILQFGPGDPFTKAMSWFGMRGSKGQLVAKIHGDKVYESDLSDLQRRRQLANQFLGAAASTGASMAQAELVQAENKLDPDFKESVRMMARDPRALQDLQRRRRLKPDELRYLADIQAFGAWSEWRRTGEFYFGGNTTTESLLDFLVWRKQADKLGIVFVEEDVRKLINREAFGREFLKSNKKFDEDDTVKQFLGNNQRGRPVSAPDLMEALADEFRVALAQEILLGEGPGIRALQTLPAGSRSLADGLLQPPAVPTPEEFARFYREQRTSLDVALLPVPTRRYRDEVKAQPTDKELLELYEQGKSRVWAPDSTEPGFKIPRRARIEFLSAESSAPYYQEAALLTLAAANRLPASFPDPALGRWWHTARVPYHYRTGASALGQVLAPQAPAGGFVPAVAAVALLQDPLAARYEEEQETARRLGIETDPKFRRPYLRYFKGVERLGQYSGEEGVKENLYGKAAYGRTPVGYVAGQVFLAPFRLGPPLAPVAVAASWYGTATLYENNDLHWYEYHIDAGLRGLGTTPLAGLPGGGLGGAVAAATACYPINDHSRDLTMWRLADQGLKTEAGRLAAAELADFQKGLRAVANKPVEAANFVADVNAGREVKVGDRTVRLGGLAGRVQGTADLENRWELEDDPVLKDLREAFEAERKLREPQLAELKAMLPPAQLAQFDPDFGEALLRPQDPGLGRAATSLYQPAEVHAPPAEGKAGGLTYVHWRVKEVLDREPKSFEEVRAAVREAWQVQEARKLARREADQLVQEVKAARLRDRQRALDYLREKSSADQLGDVFTLDGVARLVEPRNTQMAMFGGPEPYRPYQADRSKIRYPRDNMVDVFMRLENTGDAIRWSDKGESNYYVVVLLARRPPGFQEILEAYRQDKTQDKLLWDRTLMAERRNTFRKKVLEQLRREASPEGVNPEGKWNLPEGLARKQEEGP